MAELACSGFSRGEEGKRWRGRGAGRGAATGQRRRRKSGERSANQGVVGGKRGTGAQATDRRRKKGCGEEGAPCGWRVGPTRQRVLEEEGKRAARAEGAKKRAGGEEGKWAERKNSAQGQGGGLKRDF